MSYQEKAEKPFLIYDQTEGYMVYVPEVREHSTGVSWKNGSQGKKIALDQFYVAKPKKDTAETMNAALASGKNLLLTPGIYNLTEPIVVDHPDTIVLGMGFATLRSTAGNCCMETGDVTGLIVAGLLFDAGETKSDNLLIVGKDVQRTEQETENIYLSDLFFRVGGTDTQTPTSTKCCATINSSHVIGDNFWVWRADHGNQVAWNKNVAENGIIINGDDVTMYALMVEHFEQYQTIYVDDEVDTFEAWGLGVYLYNRDVAVNLDTAMEVPDKNGVKVHNICTVMLAGYPGMNHIINESGEAVTSAGERHVICEYENGLIK